MRSSNNCNKGYWHYDNKRQHGEVKALVFNTVTCGHGRAGPEMSLHGSENAVKGWV